MFESEVHFVPSRAVEGSVDAVRCTNLHMHADALEIVFVLRGELHLKVSCEDFDLQSGDFAVINRGDPHMLTGSADNVTAVVHLDLSTFRDIDPFADYIVFACESFDLARYRRQESLLRGLLLDMVEGLIEDPAAAEHPARATMTLLCAGYSLEDYYNRNGNLTRAQREKFRRIVRHLWDAADARDVLAVIAADEHYSKSYVSHTVKDVAAVSFTDLLVYFRVSRAEALLLTGDATMLEIAARCGFSDVKYFTRSFVNWFHASPADYRRMYQPDVLRDNELTAVPNTTTRTLIRDHRSLVASPAGEPRLSVTPLLLKNLGSRKDLFAAELPARRLEPEAPVAPESAHLLPIRVTTADVGSGYLLDALTSFDQIRATPCLVVEYSTRATTFELIAAIAGRLQGLPSRTLVMWLTYSTVHDRDGVDDIVAQIQAQYGLRVQPIFTP